MDCSCHYSLFEGALWCQADGDEPALGHPPVGVFEGLLAVRLEDYALTRSEAAHIDQLVKFLRQLPQVVVLVALRMEVDVTLSPDQRPDVPLHVAGRSVSRNEESDDERCVDHLSETLLLEHIDRRSEDIGRIEGAVEHQPQAVVGSAREAKPEHASIENPFKRLDCREVAARVQPNPDLHGREVLRRAYRRVGPHKDSAWGNAVRATPETAARAGGGNVHRPVTSAAYVARSTIQHGLERA